MLMKKKKKKKKKKNDVRSEKTQIKVLSLEKMLYLFEIMYIFALLCLPLELKKFVAFPSKPFNFFGDL